MWFVEQPLIFGKQGHRVLILSIFSGQGQEDYCEEALLIQAEA